MISLMPKKSKRRSESSDRFIQSGTMTYSKMACRYVEEIYPKFIASGNGAFVTDIDGRTFIDYPCALGANLLGYSHPYVNERVKETIDRGILFSMPSLMEGELAEKLCHLFPSMEKVRFFKSGSEAVSAGIKIARAYTNRTLVLSSGYHGWHDWSTPITPNRAGTPSELDHTIMEFEYDNLEDLKEKLSTHQVACVVLDPYLFHEPETGYYSNLIKLAHKHGALVLFDEVVTGFRWRNWSVQNHYGVRPDLSAFGKSMANGFPISVIGGKSKIMKVLDKDCFVSTTFGGDLVGISAALATIKVCEDENAQERIWESGLELKQVFNSLAQGHGLEAICLGNPARLKLQFPTEVHKAVFWQECCMRGILFGAAQHTTLSHTDSIIDETNHITNDVLAYMSLYWNDPKNLLKGKLPKPVTNVAKLRK